MFRYPASDLDAPRTVLESVGGFWSAVYADADNVAMVLHARAQLDVQNHDDMLALADACGRKAIDVYRRVRWAPLRLLESGKDSITARLAKFDGSYVFDYTGLLWGVPAGPLSHAWVVPAGLLSAAVVLDNVHRAQAALISGVDFLLKDGVITFRDNPFASGLFSPQDVYEGGTITDRELVLWACGCDIDTQLVHRQYGYVLGLAPATSQEHKGLINGAFDALVDGGTARSVDNTLSALCGAELAVSDGEVVEALFRDGERLWIVTDRAAYSYGTEATPLVAIGDVLQEGDALTDALQLYELNRGVVPPGLRAVAVGEGLLAPGYQSELVFEANEAPLVVEENVQGYTKVSFAVGGLPADADRFWDQVHASGVAAGQTLAMLMDQRPVEARDTQPTALALPTAISPLGFLVENIFRNNLYVAAVRPRGFGPGALGLRYAHVLRKLIPAHVTLMVVVTLDGSDDAVILDAPGTETAPGVSEAMRSFSPGRFAEAVVPALWVREAVRLRQLGGRCA